MRLFLQAFLANSEKSCFIIGNLTILKVSCNTLKAFINMFAEYVHHSAAAGAHKVTMGNGAGIESVCSAKAGKLLDVYKRQVSMDISRKATPITTITFMLFRTI